MTQKNTEQIRTYYTKAKVVGTYNTRRFAGVGGDYINKSEIAAIIDTVSYANPTPHTVLDLGAGRGRLSLPLKKRGLTVYCLDSSHSMINALRRYFPKAQRLEQSVFDKLKSSMKYDLCTSLRFYDHFSLIDQQKILHNILPSLAKNSQIIFACLNSASWESWLGKMVSYGRYNYYYSHAEYLTMFKKLGLRGVLVQTKFFLPRGIFLYVQKIPGLTPLFMWVDRLLIALRPRSGALFVYLLSRS